MLLEATYPAQPECQVNHSLAQSVRLRVYFPLETGAYMAPFKTHVRKPG